MGGQKINDRRKVVFGFTALIAAMVVIIGLGFAYFSDVITGNGTATAGTLDIDGTISLSQNGTAVANGAISNFNPGDVITIAGSSITNAGTKSAWVRTILDFTAISSTDNANAAGDLASYLYVCPSSVTDASLRSAADGTAIIALGCQIADTTTKFGAKTTYTNTADVVDGTVEDDNGTVGSQTTLPAASLPKIYFAHFAGNDAQLGSATFSVLVQALQYRNNTTSPTEPQWSTVVDTPFAI